MIKQIIKRFSGRNKKFYIASSMFLVAAILVIVAITIGIVAVVSSKNNIKKANQAAIQMQEKKKTVEPAVFSFYTWYIHGNSNVFSDTSYKDRGTLTPDLIAKIEKNVADQKDSKSITDPIICGSAMPDTISIAGIELNNGKVSVDLNLNYIKSRKITLLLILQDNQWKINEIVCT